MMKALVLIIVIAISSCSDKESQMTDAIPLDPSMTEGQLAVTSQLSSDDLAKIDNVLLKHSAIQYRKSTRVIGATMMDIQDDFKGVPDVFYTTRLLYLVETNQLEAQGNLRRMRYSEVRLVQ